MTKDIRTGDLVLCKVGSFPPWPAVIFPQRLLRNDVYRKRKTNCVAVCFFNDPTYYWELPSRLKQLDKDTIHSFISEHSKNGNQRELVNAYKEAKKFGDFNVFLQEKFEEEKRIKDLREFEKSEGSRIVAGEDPFIGRTKVVNKRKQASAPPKDDPKGKEGRKHSNEETTQSIKPSKKKRPMDKADVKSNTSNKKKVKLDYSRKIEISLLFRRRIQRNLIQRETPPTEDDIKETHELLNRIYENSDTKRPFFDIEALRESKLHKLLKAIVNDPDLEEFHPLCKEILLTWAGLITELKKEKLQALPTP
ncbi:YLR455W [Saccharomyces arboricola H-6]|uniref:YLR455W n=1 Tax=Saccharomyces arboricola (strain H-6 / AS 2.3317 / CBS 10644) TaxID=1160507 RepID=J8PGJ1_SACAR|nr:YLR455W [Saccharomyces arboricola H-6]